MRFGPWRPLAEAPDAAPVGPGVLQARGEALLELPGGKSAMVLYAASAPDESLQTYVRGPGAPRLAAAARLGACWVRFGGSTRPADDLERLLRLFVERFGAAPAGNQETNQEP